jgi:hypothetical protein
MYDEFQIRTTSRKYVRGKAVLSTSSSPARCTAPWVLYNSQQEHRDEEEIIVMQMKTLFFALCHPTRHLGSDMIKTVRESELLLISLS